MTEFTNFSNRFEDCKFDPPAIIVTTCPHCGYIITLDKDNQIEEHQISIYEAIKQTKDEGPILVYAQDSGGLVVYCIGSGKAKKS